jgi:hypothetical protein
MHPRILVPVALLACASAFAQAPAAPTAAASASAPLVQDSPTLEGRKNQKVEKIHIEDSRVAIDEMRYGGRTESITVHPKDDMPAYEVQPSDKARGRPIDGREGLGATTGPRVWNFLRF